MFRIVQESLTNSLKHGEASDIHLSLAQDSDQTILEISDNGKGFDVQSGSGTTTEGSGLGLRIMKYRANTIGCELYVSRNSQHGITVRCIIPTLGAIA
ncbi:ATP-binding protein [Pirellulaceae bacterium SH501]